MEAVPCLDPDERTYLANELADLGCIIYDSRGIPTRSGVVVDRYFDNRKASGMAAARALIMKPILRNINEETKTIVSNGIDGTMISSMVAYVGNFDLVSVRDEAKVHGTKKIVDGYYQSGSKATIIDGTTSQGKTLLYVADKVKNLTNMELVEAITVLFRSNQIKYWRENVSRFPGKIKYLLDDKDLYALPRSKLLTNSSPAR